MEKKKILMPSPRPEVIRARYASFLSLQAKILKNSRKICEWKIKEMQKKS